MTNLGQDDFGDGYDETRDRERFRRVVALWFLVVFAGVAFGMGCLCLPTLAALFPGHSLHVTEGTVVQSRPVAVQDFEAAGGRFGGGGRTAKKYMPLVCYEYDVDGVDYVSYRVGVRSPLFASEEDASERCREYPLNAPVTVYYDPQNPTYAILDRAIEPGLYVCGGIWLFAVLVCAAAVRVLYAGRLFRWR